MSVLRFAAVRKFFAGKAVLNGLDFAVGEAEVYGLLGPNGSGKSTAINILCNLLDADAGRVEIDGGPAACSAQAMVGICPQEITLYRDLYPAENLRFFCDVYGLTAHAARLRIAFLMQLFGLNEVARTRIAVLSGGWQRRVNIAVALVHSPRILVLDEPTAGLDVEARQSLWRIVERLKTQGMTILLTTHHLDEAERLCSRIGIMKDGRIAHQGSVEELLSLVPAKLIAVVETSDPDAVEARAHQLGWEARDYAGKLGLLLPRPMLLEEVVQSIRGTPVSSITLQRVSLEHVYLQTMHETQPQLGLAARAIA